jgi:hypothetical protein
MPIVIQIGGHPSTVHGVDGVDQLRQMQLDAAVLSQRGTGGPAGRTFHATAANLIANLCEIFGNVVIGYRG